MVAILFVTAFGIGLTETGKNTFNYGVAGFKRFATFGSYAIADDVCDPSAKARIANFVRPDTCDVIVESTEEYWKNTIYIILVLICIMSGKKAAALAGMNNNQLMALATGDLVEKLTELILSLGGLKSVLFSFVKTPLDYCFGSTPQADAAPPTGQQQPGQVSTGSASSPSSPALPQVDVQGNVQGNVPEPSVGVQGDEDESDDDASVQERKVTKAKEMLAVPHLMRTAVQPRIPMMKTRWW